VVHTLAGNQALAAAWAANARARNPGIGRNDFFRAFPTTSREIRERAAMALVRLGF
jgi:hypothetical protein